MSLFPKERILLIGLACVAVALLYPVKSTVCPAWTIQVVDEAGNPLKGVFVRQHWQDYTVESSGHRQDTETDENGYVSFPERTIRAPLLFRALGVVLNTVSGGFIHSSYGPHAFIAAYGDIVDGKRIEGSANYEEGKPLPKQLNTRINDLGLR
jgi:hypothetical protein